MGFLTRVLMAMVRILTFPFRLIGRVFGGTSATTARKAAGSVASMDAAMREAMSDAPQATQSFPFVPSIGQDWLRRVRPS